MDAAPEHMGFFGAAQIARIHRHFDYLSSGRQSDETVLAITSLAPQADEKANAQALLEIARGHWSIENGNHYVRDRSYDEDRCQVRDPNSAHLLSTLRSLARFLAKREVHHPKNAHQKTVPALHRYCNAHRSKAIHWLLSADSPC